MAVLIWFHLPTVHMLKPRARFIWRVGFKLALGGRELFHLEGFVALVPLT